MVEFILNNERINSNKPTGSLLLDFVRHDKALTGTKIGCREGDCGACTVLIGELIDDQMKYQQVTSCLTPISNVHGKHVVTVEGLNMEDLSPVQKYMVDEAGTQCGFCTVGFVVSLTGFCLANSAPTYEGAIAAINGNICRCTGYKSIERAAKHVTNSLANKDTNETVNWLAEHKFIPAYFDDIRSLLEEIEPAHIIQGTGELVGGGTDVYVQKPDELIVKNVGTIASDPGLRFIEIENGTCILGGGTTVSDLLESEALRQLFPRLSEHIILVSSSLIRNISTLAGNFVNASPIGDFSAFFLALNAKITLTENKQSRSILLKDFYKGYKDLDKSDGEIITSISFEVPTNDSHFNLEKVSKRTHLDIASVNTAIQISVVDNAIASAHISAGGIGPIPTYLRTTGEFLEGKEISTENIKVANEILQLEISPISDVRGTADYKRLLLRQLFFAHFIKLFPDQITLESLQ
ncbi:MAG: 2Fe-2S iron-sulfur cluster binding domain-containing protein [Cytophagales bacterium]|nr:2Fe-2S iron-sulfur cluster binding domain-containing protein [Cytophagales bacterium]